MRLNVIAFPSRMFDFDKRTKTFSAETSDLGNRHLQMLYDDAADVGFGMTSTRTGNQITFGLLDVKKDAEGDITSWTYAPTADSIRKVPECLRMKAEIFND